MQTFRLFCWMVTNSIFNAKLSMDAVVCLISSPTCSWWLPSSSSIAGCKYKSQNLPWNKNIHTFKPHISTRWIFVAPQWLLKLLLQGLTSKLQVLLIILVSIVDTCDEDIKLCENCYNGNCMESVAEKKEFESGSKLTISCSLIVEEGWLQF